MSNDSDPDGDPLSVVSADGAAFGTVRIVDGQAIYTPNDGYVGADQFTYVVTDGQGGFIEGVVNVQVNSSDIVPEPTPEPVAPEPEPTLEPVAPGPGSPEPTGPEPTVLPEPAPAPEPIEPGSIGFAANFFSVSEDTSSLSDVDFSGEPTSVGFVDALQYLEVTGSFTDDSSADFFASEYTTVLNVTDTGSHQIFLLADDFARVILNGDVILDSSDTEQGDLMSVWTDLDAGSYDLQVQYLEIQCEQTLNSDWAGPSTDGEVVPMVGILPSEAPEEDNAVPVIIAEDEVVIEDQVQTEKDVIVEDIPVAEPAVEAPKEETPDVDLGEKPRVEAPATPVGVLEAAGETEFNVVSVETTATSLDGVDFSGATNIGQTTNGISLASTDGALLDGGPSDSGLQFSAQISVETAGLYEIGLAADDYAVVNISGLPVVGVEPGDDEDTQFNFIFLTAGDHSVEVQYLDVGGAQSLDVSASLFSDDVSARSDEEAFAISMSEAEQTEQDMSFVF